MGKRKIKILKNDVIVEVSAEIYRYGGYSFALLWEFDNAIYAYELSTGKCVGCRARNVKAPKQELIATIQRDVDSGIIPQAREVYINSRIAKFNQLKEAYERAMAPCQIPLNKEI